MHLQTWDDQADLEMLAVGQGRAVVCLRNHLDFVAPRFES